jgi:hypothetical protein
LQRTGTADKGAALRGGNGLVASRQSLLGGDQIVAMAMTARERSIGGRMDEKKLKEEVTRTQATLRASQEAVLARLRDQLDQYIAMAIMPGRSKACFMITCRWIVGKEPQINGQAADLPVLVSKLDVKPPDIRGYVMRKFFRECTNLSVGPVVWQDGKDSLAQTQWLIVTAENVREFVPLD